MHEGIIEVERLLSQESKQSVEGRRVSDIMDGGVKKKKIDPAALAALSDSESAGVDEYNNDDTVNPLTAVCTDVIDKKVRVQLNNMVELDSSCEGKEEVIDSQNHPEVRLLEGILEKKGSVESLRSSKLSEGIIKVTKDYLIGVYNKATHTIMNNSEQELRMLDKNEIIFT